MLLSDINSMIKPNVPCRTEGKVIKITDGDTVPVLDAEETTHKIRLAGIDAPERGQPYGKAAGNFYLNKSTNKTFAWTGTSAIVTNGWSALFIMRLGTLTLNW